MVAQFILEPGHAQQLEATMRRRWDADVRPLKGGGFSIHYAGDVRLEKVADLRSRTRSQAAQWIARHLPGVFSSLEGLDAPVWDLLTVDGWNSDQKDGVHDWIDFVAPGSIGRLWKSTDTSLYLAEPFAREGGPTAVFAATLEAIVALDHDQGETKTAAGGAYHADRRISPLLAGMAVQQVISEARRRFAHIRDDLATPRRRSGKA